MQPRANPSTLSAFTTQPHSHSQVWQTAEERPGGRAGLAGDPAAVRRPRKGGSGLMGLCHPPVPAVCPALRPCAPWATVVESGLGRRVCAIRPALGKRETVLPLLTIPWWLRTPSGKRPTAGEGGSSGSRRTHSTGQTAARAPIRPGLVLRSTGPPDRNPPARPHPRRVSFSLKFRSRARGGRGGRAGGFPGRR